MTNGTSTHRNFTEAWCYRMIAKHQWCHYTPAADAKKNKEWILQPTPLPSRWSNSSYNAVTNERPQMHKEYDSR